MTTPLFPARPSTREDFLDRDYRDAEIAALEAAQRLAAATHCEACEAPLGDDREIVDGFVIGACCGRRLAAAFLPEILSAVGETRWGASS